MKQDFKRVEEVLEKLAVEGRVFGQIWKKNCTVSIVSFVIRV